jgi:uncharacterized protein YegL
VLLMVDVSGSMAPNLHEDKIGVLNRCIDTMLQAFASYDAPRGLIYTAVIVFGGETARLHLPFTLASEAQWTEMTASGRTPMDKAFDMANDLLADPKDLPAKPFRSAMILVSDGYPNDGWEEPLADLIASERGSKALRIAVGIGTDMTPDARRILQRFSTPGVDVLQADQVHELPGMFQWVTNTVTSTFSDVSFPSLQDLDRP